MRKSAERGTDFKNLKAAFTDKGWKCGAEVKKDLCLTKKRGRDGECLKNQQ